MTSTEDTTIADEAIANIGGTDLTKDDVTAIVMFIFRETDGCYFDLKRAPLGGIMKSIFSLAARRTGLPVRAPSWEPRR